ncbi:hypothetical protein ACLB2K_038058 [Fragaria x ananassa]
MHVRLRRGTGNGLWPNRLMVVVAGHMFFVGDVPRAWRIESKGNLIYLSWLKVVVVLWRWVGFREKSGLYRVGTAIGDRLAEFLIAVLADVD